MKQIFSKSLLMTLIIIILIVAVPQAVSASKIGDVIDYVLYTDIVAYIDKQPIQSFNINGYTAVIVEDLAYYGFDVVWEASTRSLYSSRSNSLNTDKKSTYIPNDISNNMVGKRAASVLYTDIKCFFDGRQIDSFNIGGKTIIYIDDLAKIYGKLYIWNSDKRTLSLDLVAPWHAHIENSEYDVKANEILDGFVLSFDSHSTNENANFIVSDYSADYTAIDSIDVSDKALSFSIYQQIETFGDFFKIFNEAINIKYGERIENDTTERRKALSSVFRIYINNEMVNGELAYSQGNGHAIYQFIFDKHINLPEIKSIRVELGF